MFIFWYERLFLSKPHFFFTGGLGLGCRPIYKDDEEFNYILDIIAFNGATLQHITMNVGKGRHYCEFGMGATQIIGNIDQHYYYYAIIGYRLEEKDGNIRIYSTFPLNGWENSGGWFIIGTSFGLGF